MGKEKFQFCIKNSIGLLLHMRSSNVIEVPVNHNWRKSYLLASSALSSGLALDLRLTGSLGSLTNANAQGFHS